jgi:ABC-type Fe3+/spermidine/putrescine transport system ATPase subunit
MLKTRTSNQAIPPNRPSRAVAELSGGSSYRRAIQRKLRQNEQIFQLEQLA